MNLLTGCQAVDTVTAMQYKNRSRTFRFTPELWDAMGEESARLGITRSEWLRRTVTLALSHLLAKPQKSKAGDQN